MRYHYEKPTIYLSMYGKRYICNHPVYDSCTLFEIEDKGLAVIQQRYGPYAKVFDDTHSDWKQDPEMNLFYLRARQAQANDMLKSQGHLFLNEVYDMLGFKRTKAGAVVGWIYDDKKPYGDNFVDFGMTEIRRHDADSDEYKRAFILDFNVVGDITSKIVDHQNDYLA